MDLAALGDGGWLVGRGLGAGAGMMDDGTAVDDVDLASGKRARELLLPAPPNDSHQCSPSTCCPPPSSTACWTSLPSKIKKKEQLFFLLLLLLLLLVVSTSTISIHEYQCINVSMLLYLFLSMMLLSSLRITAPSHVQVQHTPHLP